MPGKRRGPRTPTVIGSRLLAAREAAGMYGKELARLCGVTSGYISQVELGDIKKPSAEFIRRAEEALQLRVGSLTDDEDTLRRRRAALDVFLSQYRDKLNITER